MKELHENLKRVRGGTIAQVCEERTLQHLLFGIIYYLIKYFWKNFAYWVFLHIGQLALLTAKINILSDMVRLKLQ